MNDSSREGETVFAFRCACGRSLKGRASLVGKNAICPACGKKLVVPPPTGVEPQQIIAARHPAPPFARQEAEPRGFSPQLKLTLVLCGGLLLAVIAAIMIATMGRKLPPEQTPAPVAEQSAGQTKDAPANPTPAKPETPEQPQGASSPPPSPDQKINEDKTVEEIFKQSSNSVVVVSTSKGTGSGFILSEDGVIATNSHVIQNSSEDEVKIHVISSDGKVTTTKTIENVQIVIDDSQKDIAILKVAQTGLVPLLLAERSLTTGEKVIAIGNPAPGDEILANTVSEGIISNPARNIEGGIYIQTTAAVNPGNSGGPLLDSKGQVVGMITLKANSVEGIAFAIPAAEIKKVWEESKNVRPEVVARRNLLNCCNNMAALEDKLGAVLEFYRAMWAIDCKYPEVSEDFPALHKAVSENKRDVAELRKVYTQLQAKIKNMGQGPSRAFDELINAFAVVGEMMELAEDPTGSYNSFTQRIKDLHSSFTQMKIKVETLAP